jgi:hypothetical protein
MQMYVKNECVSKLFHYECTKHRLNKTLTVRCNIHVSSTRLNTCSLLAYSVIMTDGSWAVASEDELREQPK